MNFYYTLRHSAIDFHALVQFRFFSSSLPFSLPLAARMFYCCCRCCSDDKEMILMLLGDYTTITHKKKTAPEHTWRQSIPKSKENPHHSNSPPWSEMRQGKIIVVGFTSWRLKRNKWVYYQLCNLPRVCELYRCVCVTRVHHLRSFTELLCHFLCSISGFSPRSLQCLFNKKAFSRDYFQSIFFFFFFIILPPTT